MPNSFVSASTNLCILCVSALSFFPFFSSPSLDCKLFTVGFSCTGLNVKSAATSTAAGPPTTIVASSLSIGAWNTSAALPTSPILPHSSATMLTKPSIPVANGTPPLQRQITASTPKTSSLSPVPSNLPGLKTTPSTPNSFLRTKPFQLALAASAPAQARPSSSSPTGTPNGTARTASAAGFSASALLS